MAASSQVEDVDVSDRESLVLVLLKVDRQALLTMVTYSMGLVSSPTTFTQPLMLRSNFPTKRLNIDPVTTDETIWPCSKQLPKPAFYVLRKDLIY